MCDVRACPERSRRGGIPQPCAPGDFPSVPQNPTKLVILSGAETSRSEVPAQSKDPYELLVSQEYPKELSPYNRASPRSRVPHPNVALSATLGWDSTDVCAGGFSLSSTNPKRNVILSGAETSRSEVPAQSKDPYELLAGQGRPREFSPCSRISTNDTAESHVSKKARPGAPRRVVWTNGGKPFMRVDDKVPFEQVRVTFLNENPDPTYRATTYTSGLLDEAERQFGEWHRAVLASEDILGVMLPWHAHEGFELVPKSGLIVSDAVGRLELAAPSHECRRQIESLSQAPLSTVFLSTLPLTDNQDYRELARRGYKGLIHLDGLHRLIAWASSGRTGVVAYVAGTLSKLTPGLVRRPE